MPQIRPFSYGQAVAQGNQNALSQMQLQQGPERHQNAMRESKLRQMTAGLNYIIKSAPGVTKETYKPWQNILIENKIAAPGDMPEEFDEDYMAGLYGATQQQLKKMSLTSGTPQGPMTQDFEVRGGVKTPYGKPYSAKKTGKDSRTALQKNVPFIQKAMKITRKEAAELLTQSKDKSPKQFWGDIYGRTMSATFGDQAAAEQAANKATETLYGPGWKNTEADPLGILE